MQQLKLEISIKNESDLQALVGLYIGLLSAGQNNQSGSLILDEVCTQLESQLQQMYTPQQWTELQNELGGYVTKAKAFASNAENFKDFQIS